MGHPIDELADEEKAYFLGQDAYHEASHAVMAFLVGMPFQQVSIEREYTEKGYFLKGVRFAVADLFSYRVYPRQPRRTLQSKIGKLAVGFAGEIGQALTGEAHLPKTGARDDELIVELLIAFFPEKAEYTSVLRQASDYATQALLLNERNVAAIRQLAAALMKKETLSYDEACRIIRRARRIAKKEAASNG